MAKVADVNNDVANGAEAIFILKELLKSAGWTVPSSSDGTTYNAAGDQITLPGSGAGGMDNANAWFVVRDPGGLREFCFQRGATENVWRIKYSASDRFIIGSPGATQVPGTAREIVMHGAGTDAAPTFAQLFSAAGTQKFHVIARDDAYNGVYGWWAFASGNGTAPVPGKVDTGMFCEPLAIGSLPPEDPEPVIVAVTYLQPFFDGTYSTGGNGVFVWYDYGGPNQTVSNDCDGNAVRSENNEQVFPSSGAGPMAVGGRIPAFPIVWANDDQGTGEGYKGVSRYLLWSGDTGIDYPSTMDLTTDAHVFVTHCLIPWPENIAPILT